MRSADNKNNIIQEVSDIFFKPKHIVARCHHDTCKKNNVSWNQLYFAKTGEKYNTKDKRISESKNNGDKNVSLINVLEEAFDNNILEAFRDEYNTIYCRYYDKKNDTYSIYELHSYELRLIIQKLMVKVGMLLKTNDMNKPLDYIANNENGSEYWSARELAVALDYVQWRNFEKVIKRAMIACENSGHNVLDDFAEVSKIVEAGATHKSTKDYELSRYACYLIVQNGDPRKEVIALGQTYFAIQTYRQEVDDHFNELDEDNRRLVVRGDIKQWNQMLAETAHNAGVITNEEFAIFQNAGYMGLYGGLDVDDIHTRKQLEVGQKILDYMGSTELIANLFRISQTEEKLRKDKIQGAERATSVHYNVGKEVRNAIEKIGGTMPEDLPTPEKSIQQIEKEQMERLRSKAKNGKLMLDE